MLGHVLDVVLRLLHPLIAVRDRGAVAALTGGESIVVAPWPNPEPFSDPAAEAEITGLMRLVTEIRRFRADQGLKPGQKVAASLEGVDPGHEDAVRALLRLTEPGEGFAATASLSVGDAVVRLDTAGAIDVVAERARLEKDLAVARKEIAQAEGKLGNEQFMAKAPEKVVAKTRGRLEEARADVVRLERQLALCPDLEIDGTDVFGRSHAREETAQQAVTCVYECCRAPVDGGALVT